MSKWNNSITSRIEAKESLQHVTGFLLFFKAHPTKQYFAVGEKGKKPNLIIYDYPSLRPYRILRGSVKSSIFILHKWASVYRSQQME